MNSSAASHDTDDLLLAEFFAAWERRGSAAITEYVQRYPHLAEQIYELVRLHEAVDETRPGALLPGRKLGDFRILRRVGGGGMGDVYEAIQEHLGRRVALKVIRHGRVSDDARNRFLREQQVLARLHQTHIVPIHFAGEEGNLQYFVMPFIRGAALHDVIAAARRFPAAQPATSVPPLPVLAGLKVQADAADKDRPVRAAGDPSQETPTVLHHARSTSPAGKGQTDSRVPAPAGAPQLVLSRAYFRSVAALMADAAEALEHTHNAVGNTDEPGVLHRDLKPANIMVDREGKCWIIDFGLASSLKEGGGPAPGGMAAPGPYTVSGVVGTPEYMAPEQLDGKADVRTDVWGLGATLYELLTLRRPFTAETRSELRRKIREETPEPPGRLVQGMPPDLAAICLKAIQKDPARRYQTAGEVATDLRRWLAGEPTRARPPWVPRRLALWAGRHKGGAAAALLALGVALLLAGLVGVWQERNWEAERQGFIREAQQWRLGAHGEGWSGKAWSAISRAAKVRPDDLLRSEGVPILGGLDTSQGSTLSEDDASAVVFDASGSRLLIGGTAQEPARIWDREANRLASSGQAGAGPVAFRADRTAVQLIPAPDNPGALLLWDAVNRRLVRRFTVGNAVGVSATFRPLLALSPDGSLVAASAAADTILVWETSSGEQLFRSSAKVAALAFSPDSSFLAVAEEGKQVTVWSVRGGELVCSLPTGGLHVRALAFGPAWGRLPGGSEGAGRWLLATGDSGGSVTVWDVETRVVRSLSRGSNYDIFALAFSPDGTLLASGGRGQVKLWDVATGRHLLDFGDWNVITGVAFAPDGHRLAVSSVKAFGGKGGVEVWDLEFGRGLDTLRGLGTQVSKVQFSSDGKLLAALAHGWRVGVWDVDGGELRHLLPVTPGLVADNAALAFSPDGKRFAFAAGEEARLWDVESGKEIRRWVGLPPALQDTLAFDAAGRLLLFRVETKDGKRGPFREDLPRNHSRVCRIRNLLGPKPEEPIAEIPDLDEDVYLATVTPDGAYFVVEGRGGAPSARSVLILEAASGNKRWAAELSKGRESAHLALDPTGRTLAFVPKSRSSAVLVEVPDGTPLATLSGVPTALSSEARYWAEMTSGRYELYGRKGGAPLLAFGLGPPASSVTAQFSADGRRLTWGNADGTVTVVDLKEMHRRLASQRLGWE